MNQPPSGTVTFLFSDIEGSTRLAQDFPDTWEDLRAQHHAILHSAMEAHNGYVFQIVGDAFCVAFHTASDALRAALKSQVGLYNHDWGLNPLKVRMGIHTGKAEFLENGEYRGYLAMSRVQRLTSAAHGGQVLVSNAAQELARDDLPESVTLHDMGEHRLKDLIRPEHIFQLIIPNLPVEFPPIKTLDAYRHNLPTQLTSFIGREKEMAEVKQAVNDHRLVTLTGSGGTGKTRLSLQVAAELLDQFPDGVWFVELASTTDPDLISQTILSVFKIGDQPGMSSLQLLTNYLREKALLLILDNCEHLIEAIANLAKTLLDKAPRLRILATSREALGITGECNWHVPSLSLPDIQQLPAIDGLSQYEAVRLFIDRATLAQPHFMVTKDNAPAIAQICSRLDGIPLAIELAAVRVNALSVDQISKRLDDRFRLLTGGSRTALPRQQTLRATIDWSYNLLSDQEKILFRRLAVFVGGWRLEAAEQVCSMDQNDLVVFDLLAHLVDKSLVIVDDTANELRYHMLETTRQYAREKLLESEEGEVLRNRHVDWYLKFTVSANKELEGPNQILWLHKLDAEMDNLRAAMAWSFSSKQLGVTAIQIVNALEHYWDYRSLFNEAFSWMEKAEVQSRTLMGTPIRAKLLGIYALHVYSILGRWKEARPMLEESLETFRNHIETHQIDYAYTLIWLGFILYFNNRDKRKTACGYLQEGINQFKATGDRRGLARALNLFADIKINEGDVETAIKMQEEGKMLYKESGDRYGSAICEMDLGNYHLRKGNYPEARKHFEDSLSVFSEFENKGYASQVLAGLGESYLGLKKHLKAEAYFRESLSMKKEIGVNSRWYIGDNLYLGYSALFQGDDRMAISSFKEALSTSQEWDSIIGQTHCLAGFAAVAAVRGEAETAAILYGAMDAQIQKLIADGKRLDNLIAPVDRLQIDHYQLLCRNQLGEEDFEIALSEGRAMTMEQALELAMQTVGEDTD